MVLKGLRRQTKLHKIIVLRAMWKPFYLLHSFIFLLPSKRERCIGFYHERRSNQRRTAAASKSLGSDRMSILQSYVGQKNVFRTKISWFWTRKNWAVIQYEGYKSNFALFYTISKGLSLLNGSNCFVTIVSVFTQVHLQGFSK
jgi:hypothetical protein